MRDWNSMMLASEGRTAIETERVSQTVLEFQLRDC